MDVEVWPDAQPFSFDGGATGVLIVHGFTSCPQSIRPFGEGLSKAGFTVKGPRLPGHGTSVKDLGTRKWQEWTGEAEKALQELQERCDKVFITGLSMGGGITLYLGEKYGDKLAGLMPINATATRLNNPLVPFIPVVKYFWRTLPGAAGDIKDPDSKEVAYDKVPAFALAELHKLMRLVKKDLPKVSAPILVISSRKDHVVHTSTGPYIMEHVGSSDKELVWLENSYHVATLDYDKDEIIRRCVDFINRLA